MKPLQRYNPLPSADYIGGLIRFGKIKIGPTFKNPGDEQQKARQRMCMARLRAERRGSDTSRHPVRVRRMPYRVDSAKALANRRRFSA